MATRYIIVTEEGQSLPRDTFRDPTVDTVAISYSIPGRTARTVIVVQQTPAARITPYYNPVNFKRELRMCNVWEARQVNPHEAKPLWETSIPTNDDVYTMREVVKLKLKG